MVSNVSHELMKERRGHTVYRMDTIEERVMERVVEEPEEFEVMQRELLETEAKTTSIKTSDYIVDNSIYKKYAKIIYVKGKDQKDYSGLEELENCIVLAV